MTTLLAKHDIFQPALHAIVPDDLTAIQTEIQNWASDGVALCITTGGTGFSQRDVTPEAVRPLLVREATGFQHVMLKTSLEKTPMAALARPVAGVTKEGVIVITVPGSPKGAVENVEALFPLLPHALDLASGGSGKEVHTAMDMPARSTQAPIHSVGHTCGHSHNHEQGHHHHHAKARTLRSMDTSQGGA